jgi:hypothetical protein
MAITIREGFFHSDRKDEKHFPRARARDVKWLGRAAFIEALTKIQESKKVTVETFKGQSKCRCCDEKNGADEYSFKMGSVTFVWPSGFLHYVEEHNVRPGLMFQDFVMQVAETCK